MEGETVGGHGSNEKKKILTTALGLLLLLTLLFSALFPVLEAGHHCSGEDCPVCSCIAMCENALQQLGCGMITLLAVVLPLFFLVLSHVSSADIILQATPVSKKVRLNN